MFKLSRLPRETLPRPKFEFLEVDYIQVAQALTAVQYDQYFRVRPFDFVLSLWGKDDKAKEERQNLTELIECFNQVRLR